MSNLNNIVSDLRTLFGEATRLVPYTCDSPSGLLLRAKVASVVREYHKILREVTRSQDEVIQEAARKPMSMSEAISYAAEKVQPMLEMIFEEAVRTGAAANRNKNVGKVEKLKAQDWARKQAGQLIMSITTADRNRIASAISKGIEKGKSAKSIAQDILATVNDDEMTETRALMIAVTETNMALSHGAFVSAQQRGATGKKWVVVRDKKLCERCEDNARQGIIKIDATFRSGNELTPAHPHCRCFILYDYAKAYRGKYTMPKAVDWDKVKGLSIMRKSA